MDEPAAQDALIGQFCDLAGVAPAEARQYLESNQWDLSSAAAEYFTSLEEATENPPTPQPSNRMARVSDSDDDEETLDYAPRGGRALGSGLPSGPSGPTTRSANKPPPAAEGKKAAPQKKFATIGDITGSQAEGGHDHDDDDSDDPDYRPNQDMFAGGEKSGLAVQNPDDIKRKIIEKAKKAMPRQTEPEPNQSHFTGTARTLGGDDVESQVIDDPSKSQRRPNRRVERTLHFWQDGFSVDDGQLYRSEDPRNRHILEAIRNGRAPLEIMNLEQGQEVEVIIQQHEEKYVAPTKKWAPFSGSGQRLGSPTPGVPSTTRAPATTPSAVSPPTAVEVDDSQPTLTLQIRLGDGSRLTSRFNTTHTIGDVYDFVGAASPASQQRAWVLMTTFPSKELSDKSAVLGELPGFQRGGVVVQKWT